MELERARAIAEEIMGLLDGSYMRCEIVGSVRRLKPFPNDIELLCIPKFIGVLNLLQQESSIVDLLDGELKGLIVTHFLDYRRNKKGSIVYGPKNKLLRHVESGIGVDIFSTTEECWAVSMVVRTGGKATNQRIAMAALNRGYRFHAYGSGFTTPDGEIICRSEREVFEAVGLPYLDPWERA